MDILCKFFVDRSRGIDFVGVEIMIRPNGADNKECDVIAAINVTSWVIQYHIIFMNTKAIRIC